MVAGESFDHANLGKHDQLKAQLTVVFLVVTANAVGFAPAILVFRKLFLENSWLLVVFVVGSIAISLFDVFVLEEPPRSRSPGFFELLLGGIGGIFPSAFIGLCWLIIYGVFVLSAKFFALLSWQWDIQTISFWLAVLAFVIGGLAILLNDWNFKSQLYPTGQDAQTAFFDLLNDRLWDLQDNILLFSAAFIILSMLAVVVGTALFLINEQWPGVVLLIYLVCLQLFLVVMSIGLWGLYSSEDRSREVAIAVESIGGLFELAGFELDRCPLTNDDDAIPFIDEIDFYAHTDEYRFLVKVKINNEGDEESQMQAVRHLTIATWVFGTYQELLSSSLAPLLILICDTEADIKRFESLKKQEEAWILSLCSTDVGRILNEEAVDKAKDLLRIVEIVSERRYDELPTTNASEACHDD